MPCVSPNDAVPRRGVAVSRCRVRELNNTVCSQVLEYNKRAFLIKRLIFRKGDTLMLCSPLLRRVTYRVQRKIGGISRPKSYPMDEWNTSGYGF